MLPFRQNAHKKIAIDHYILYDSRRGMGMAIDNVCIRLHKIKFFVGGGERVSNVMNHGSYVVCSHLWRIHIFRKNCVDIFSSVESHKSSVRYRSYTRSIQFPSTVFAYSVQTRSNENAHENSISFSAVVRAENPSMTHIAHAKLLLQLSLSLAAFFLIIENCEMLDRGEVKKKTMKIRHWIWMSTWKSSDWLNSECISGSPRSIIFTQLLPFFFCEHTNFLVPRNVPVLLSTQGLSSIFVMKAKYEQSKHTSPEWMRPNGKQQLRTALSATCFCEPSKRTKNCMNGTKNDCYVMVVVQFILFSDAQSTHTAVHFFGLRPFNRHNYYYFYASLSATITSAMGAWISTHLCNAISLTCWCWLAVAW